MSLGAAVTPSLVFVQTSLHRWKGRLLNSAGHVYSRTRMPVTVARFDIEEDPATGRCCVTIQGATVNSRRYVTYRSLDAAQAGGLRWAKRRFSRDDA